MLGDGPRPCYVRPMIAITEHIELDENELELSFIRAGGPGGQNVNKVATACQLRFDVRHSPSLPGYVRARAERLGGKKVSKEGVVVITASRFRTQGQNRQDAQDRLVELLKRATHRPKLRKKTRVPRAAKEKRLQNKAKRGQVKKTRGRVRRD